MSSRNNNTSQSTGGGRKRKKKELASINPDTVASLLEPVIGPPPTTNAVDNDNSMAVVAAAMLTDEQEITLIVTKRLSSDNNVNEVGAAMESLAMLVNSTPNKNAEENRQIAFRRGAPLAAVQAMRRHANSPEIQYTGLVVLSEICCCNLENFIQDIIAFGGLKYCLSAMERHDNDAYVQERGCFLIGILWGFNARKKVVDEGGLKAVVKAMKENKQKAGVQRCGCYALRTLLSKEPSIWAKTVVDAGCITLVIAAMNKHPDDAKLQLYGCEFLGRLSGAHEDYRSEILDAKGLVPVVEAQRIHKNDAMVKSYARRAHDAIIA